MRVLSVHPACRMRHVFISLNPSWTPSIAPSSVSLSFLCLKCAVTKMGLCVHNVSITCSSMHDNHETHDSFIESIMKSIYGTIIYIIIISMLQKNSYQDEIVWSWLGYYLFLHEWWYMSHVPPCMKWVAGFFTYMYHMCVHWWYIYVKKPATFLAKTGNTGSFENRQAGFLHTSFIYLMVVQYKK